MNVSRPLQIVLVAVISMGALISLVAYENYARAAGTEVLLAMEPVDPRSILSGHYVIVGLSEALAAGEDCPPGLGAEEFAWDARGAEEGWLALSPGDGRHHVSGWSFTREGAEALGELAVRGKAVCGSAAPFIETTEDTTDLPVTILADLGIDRFHVDQDQAERIDDLMWDQVRGEPDVLAIVSVGKDGKARLKGLEVEGERLELNLFQ